MTLILGMFLGVLISKIWDLIFIDSFKDDIDRPLDLNEELKLQRMVRWFLDRGGKLLEKNKVPSLSEVKYFYIILFESNLYAIHAMSVLKLQKENLILLINKEKTTIDDVKAYFKEINFNKIKKEYNGS